MRFVRDNGLSIVFLAIFLLTLVGQAIAGHGSFNHDQLLHHGATISFGRYLTTSEFAADVAENWQSEYLQFTLLMLATVWLLQRGSPESKELGKEGTESERAQKIGGWAERDTPGWARARGFRTLIYSNSLLIVMGLIFFGSWFAQSVTGWTDFNADQHTHGEPAVSWLSYIGSATFWESTLENWQSEFLAVGVMVVFTIYLRQRGSPESKAVGAPHDETASSG